MKPDKLDIKIQEAASQYAPAYTDEAWNAMEKLLDDKMPPQKKRKRFLGWLLITFFIAGGILIWTEMNKDQNTDRVSAEPGKNKEIQKQVLINEPSASTPNGSSIPLLPSTTFPNDMKQPTSSFSSNPATNATKNKPTVRRTNKISQAIDPGITKIKRAELMMRKGITNEYLPSANIVTYETGIPTVNVEAIVIPTGSRIAQPKIKFQDATNKKTKESVSQKPDKKRPENFLDRISLNVSYGPDISAVGVNNIGTVKGVVGAGLHFKINRRFSAGAGLYVSRKIYDAEPSAYNPPSNFWNYYPYLQRIDANCKVFEIPIILNYQFNQKANHQWFATAGISSYFMKTESYHYFSKDPAGQTWYSDYSINNKNRHFLSSVRLSAGYERKLSNRVSLIAEPYFNLPLSGIGYGKVRLYSTGVLFSLKIKPFSNNNKGARHY